jgi:parvulin-like peptidyl-prolyl isomerase
MNEHRFRAAQSRLAAIAAVSIVFFVWTGTVRAADAVTPPAPVTTESTSPPEPPTVPTAQPEESVDTSVLGRDIHLRQEQAYVEGKEVVWQDDVVHLIGDAYIRFENMVLESVNAWADFSKNVLRAEGKVRLTVDNEVTYADELVFDLRTKKGIAHGGAAYGAPWYYQGYEILRVSEKESLIADGRLTTSSLKYPHTYFKASKIIVRLDDEIIAKHVVFMIGGVPLLYIPAYRRSIREKKPSTVIVKLGSDTLQGNWFSVAVPLARRQRIRSAVQFDYSSLRGTGQGFENRYQIRDVVLREIMFKIPVDATPDEKTALRRKASEIQSRLAGDYDRMRVQRLFLPFAISPDDVRRARTLAEEIVTKAQAGENLDRLGGQYSSLGYLTAGDRVLEPALESAALALEIGQVSPLLETPRGFYVFKVTDAFDLYGTTEKLVEQVFIAIQANEDSKKETQEFANRVLRQAQSGAAFDELIRTHGGTIPDAARTDYEKRQATAPGAGTPPTQEGTANSADASGTDVWVPLNEFDYGQRSRLRDLNVGGVAEPIPLQEGYLILRLVDKEATPDFARLATEISEAESAKEGGLLGYVGRGDVPLNVYRSAIGLEKGEVSSVIELDDALYVVQAGQRRTMTGEFYVLTKDVYSYGSRNTFKVGRQWDALLSHRMEVPTRWDKSGRSERRGFTFWGKLDYGSRLYKPTYGTDRSQMQAFSVVTFDSVSNQGATTLNGRLTVDKTFDFAEESTGSNQRLPELTFSWSSELERLWGLRSLNDWLLRAAAKVDKKHLPLIQVPTLRDTNFSLDGSVANLFRDRYRFAKEILAIRRQRGLSDAEYQDVFLQTTDVGLDVTKQSQLRIDSTRFFVLSLNGSGQVVWHREDQKGNTNILRGIVRAGSSLSNTLFRVYDISWIPGANRLRHEVRTEAGFDWAPSINDPEEDPNNPAPDAIKLYPFGSSTYLYERKYFRVSLTTNLQIKTRSNKVIQAMNLSVRTSRDFSQREALGNRQWEFISALMNFSPLTNNNLYGSVQATVDPNTYPADSSIQRPPFSLIGFSSAIHYRGGTYSKGWSADLGSQYTQYTNVGRRSLVTGFSWRPNTLFEITMDTQWDYDRYRLKDPSGWRTNAVAEATRIAYLHPYSQNITIRRNLRDWDMRITWRRYGSLGNVRKEFTYQINLIADPTVTMGAGYDGITNSWGFRSLPIGVPTTFTAGGLGRSRF